MSKETFAGEPLDPHAAADEIVRLRGEVERLTLERDYWARARNEWEKSARLLEEENKRLTREKDEALHDHAAAMRASLQMKERAEAAERERDWHKALTQSHDLLADNATQKTRAEAAETKVAKLREALTPFIRMTPVGGGDGGTFTVEPPTGEMINIARTALQETEQ